MSHIESNDPYATFFNQLQTVPLPLTARLSPRHSLWLPQSDQTHLDVLNISHKSCVRGKGLDSRLSRLIGAFNFTQQT